MNQLEAFDLILDQLAVDLLLKRVPKHKRKPLTKAYAVLEKTRARRAKAKHKRVFSKHLGGK